MRQKCCFANKVQLIQQRRVGNILVWSFKFFTTYCLPFFFPFVTEVLLFLLTQREINSKENFLNFNSQSKSTAYLEAIPNKVRYKVLFEPSSVMQLARSSSNKSVTHNCWIRENPIKSLRPIVVEPIKSSTNFAAVEIKHFQIYNLHRYTLLWFKANNNFQKLVVNRLRSELLFN